MYNSQLIWYNKENVLNLFDIKERTYFRKLKERTPDVRTKPFKNKQGKNTTLVHYQDVGKVFERKRTPNNLNNPEVLRNYVGTKQWDLMGNIVPGKSLVYELISKMYFLYDNLKKLDKSTVVFFNIEKNTEDDFFHSHFLIRSSLKNKEIKELLFLICENELNGEKRIDLKKYDFEKYQFRGSLYSDKFGKFDSKHHSPYIHSQLLG